MAMNVHCFLLSFARNRIRHFILSILLVAWASPIFAGEDWPMWRNDAQRSAASRNSLPPEIELIWEAQFPARKQAWDDPLNLDLMTYDRVFEPIVLDGRLFMGFNDQDKLLAIDVHTGEKLWTFFAEAPIRLPPVGFAGKVYVCSDDGFLYCLSAKDGNLIWKFSGAPNSQHALGNSRLISAWPARGGPVVFDGNVYFAASIWPFMGTFIYALDAETGGVQWVNDSSGSQYIKQPHSAPAFAGVAPQGALVATDDFLIVPGGRSVPAVFNRHDGSLEYFEINAGGKGTGGSFVTADDNHFYVHTREKGTRAFNLKTGVKTAFMPNEPVLADGMLYAASVEDGKQTIQAYRLAGADGEDKELAWQIPASASGDLILAGDQLIAAGEGQISFIPVGEADAGEEPKVRSSLQTSPDVARLLVAAGKLIAVTTDGTILVYGAPGSLPTPPAADTRIEALAELPSDPNSQEIVASLLEAGDAEGYAFWFGNADNSVLASLASNSPFEQLAVVDSDSRRVEVLRLQLDRLGLYGSVSAHVSEPREFLPPKYVGHMVFVGPDLAAAAAAESLAAMYECVRPYGGVLHLLHEDPQSLAKRVEALQLEQADIAVGPHGLIVRRQGALPGSADWTHQYGDIANTIKSNDSRVKLPLGILWFGGSSNMDVLPRHGHGPPEQVVGGRLFIEGMNSLSARDVYTGRVLWKRQFEDLGTFDVYYDSTYEDSPLDPKYNQVHIPGANGRGTNYVVTHDRIYLIDDNVCRVLDPITGQDLIEIKLPSQGDGTTPEWGYIGVYEDVLIAGLGFADYKQRFELQIESDAKLKSSRAGFGSKSLDRAASRGLVGFDRHTGKILWQVTANHSFWHNGIVAGREKIYCLDKNPTEIENAMRRRGLTMPDSYRILSFDYRTGKAVWEIQEGIFGTWLGYSEEHDLLLQAGAQGSDRLTAEVGQGMAVYQGATGAVVWKKETLKYAGPCILHNDLIITNANSYSESAGAFYLKTGRQKMVKNPVTGAIQPWTMTRAYGCNNIIASENMLTFRSGAAGYYDLTSESGTGNLGGFKSGCTSNLVVANGVLNAPDYTRTCSCAYQNQTSLALVHMPDVEMWSVAVSASPSEKVEPVENLAINLGAPGDRRNADGRLWLEFPAVAEVAPPFSLSINSDARYFQQHSSTMAESEFPWIYASGVENILELTLELDGGGSQADGIPIAHANDDAEENEQGVVALGSSDLELVEDGSLQVVGLRFEDINLPRKAKIDSAYLQFTCDEPSKDPTNLIIAAELVPDADRFEANNHDISSRTRSKHEVSWKPAPWTKSGESNEAQRSPELKNLIQEVIDQDGWKAGNALALIISGQGKRTAVASSGSSGKSTRLIIQSDQADVPTTRPPAMNAYEIELYFAAPRFGENQDRVFDIVAQGATVARNVTLPPYQHGQSSEQRRVVLGDVRIADKLELRFVPKSGTPVLSGLDLRRKPAPQVLRSSP